MSDEATARGPRRTQERLRRLLVMLPWLMERGEVPVAEVAARFHVSERHLIQDLEVASMCGLPPYLDELIDIWIDDGVVHVGVPRLFTRPLRLTAPEGFALLAAGRAAMTLPGADASGPLGRALGKLAAAVGADEPALVVDVERPAFLDLVQAAVDRSERLAVTYYSPRAGALRTRPIDPQSVYAARGRWYVVADDSLTGAPRTFRVDRMEAAEPTGEHFSHRDVPVGADWFADADTVEAVVLLPTSAAWVTETYPVEEVTDEPDGRLRVRLPIFHERWLERLLLRAGPEAEVLLPTEWTALGRRAATRLLERYA
jgi:predicted DNA-binding transcriptional regulator YafY